MTEEKQKNLTFLTLCQVIIVVLLVTVALATLGAALFIAAGAVLSRWLPLSLFQACALAVGAAIAIALVAQAITTTLHLLMDHAETGDFDWVPIERDPYPSPSSASGNLEVGRHQPCPCDSGKKFKNCCGKSTPA